MKYLLTIFFINLANEPVMLDGWYPLELPTVERCEAAKKRIEEYIDLMIEDDQIRYITGYEVSCTEIKND